VKPSPKWVPRAVRDVATKARYGGDGGKAVRRRLLTDPQMKQVWKTLARYSMTDLRERYQIETWVDHNYKFSAADRSCVAFFLAALEIFTNANPVAKRRDIQREVLRLRNIASECRNQLYSLPHCVGAFTRTDTRAGLLSTAEYFEGKALRIKTRSAVSPYVIGNAGGERMRAVSDDAIRGQVRHLALMTSQMFGNPLYQTVATAASVATGFNVSKKNVENRCKDLAPSQFQLF